MPSSSPDTKPSLKTPSGIQGLACLYRAVNDVANAITREALALVIEEDGRNFLDRPQRDRNKALLVISYAQRLRDGLLAVKTRADLNKFGLYIPEGAPARDFRRHLVPDGLKSEGLVAATVIPDVIAWIDEEHPRSGFYICGRVPSFSPYTLSKIPKQLILPRRPETQT